MRIKNITRNTNLVEKAVESTSIADQLFGLIFKKTPYVLIFQTRFGIHTFFMKYPIDVIVLDRENRVAKIKKNLSPNKIFLWNPIHAKVIELPTGSIEKSKTQIGDFLEFI